MKKGVIPLFLITFVFLITNVSAGNEVYGSLWNDEAGITPIDSSLVYYNISNLTVGKLKGVTFVNESLLIEHSGVYLITSQLSFSGQANTEYHLALGINSVRSLMCHAQRKLGGGDVGSASYACLENLSAGDYLTPMIENVDNLGDANAHDIQLNIVYMEDLSDFNDKWFYFYMTSLILGTILLFLGRFKEKPFLEVFAGFMFIAFGIAFINTGYPTLTSNLIRNFIIFISIGLGSYIAINGGLKQLE